MRVLSGGQREQRDDGERQTILVLCQGEQTKRIETYHLALRSLPLLLLCNILDRKLVRNLTPG